MKYASKSQYLKGTYTSIWPLGSKTTAYPQEYVPKQAAVYPQESIPKQTTAYPQEPIPLAVIWEEALSNLLINLPDIIDGPDEELVQKFLLESWVKTQRTQTDVANANMEYFASIYILLTTGN